MTVRAGARREPCSGSVHVIPVPAGRTPQDVWAEIVTLGRLHDTSSGKVRWAVMSCPGHDDCVCQYSVLSPFYRRRIDGRLVEAHLFGRRVPGWLLPVVRAAWWLR